MAEPDGQKHRGNLLPPWPKGVSPNPGGKPVNARNRLNAKFLEVLAEDFLEHGKKAVVACRETDPSAYIRALLALQPKEVEIIRPMGDLTDEQLAAALVAARSLATAAGIDPGEGADPAPEPKQAQVLQAVPEAV